jgi:putative phage-type endonuclease
VTAVAVDVCAGPLPRGRWACPDGVMVLRSDAPTAEWLAARKEGIGSSDASAVLGLNPWTSAYEVWAEKLGLLPADPGNNATELGHLLEPVIADRWSRQTGIPVRRAGLMRSKARPWQQASVDRLAACGGLVEIKCVDVTTPVLTTRGWVAMGDLDVGDRVYAPNGHPVVVVGTSPEMTGKDCYEVATSDGRRLVVDAGHLWTVQDMHRNHKLGQQAPWETISTEELLRRGVRVANGRQLRFRLPEQQSILSPPIDLPLDPYLLGAWLGDGDAHSATITVGSDDLDYMTRLLSHAGAQVGAPRPSRTCWRVTVGIPGSVRRHQGRPLAGPSKDTFTARLRDLGVLENKHVPESYLLAGTSQRLALLQGLLDADGGISTRGQVTFCSTVEQIADSVLYLARSLGWSATIRRYDRGNKPYWLVRFLPTTQDPAPFRLPRKMERVRAARRQWAVRIASVDPVESRPVRCIRVDSVEHLFLAGRDLVPTHNTLSWRVAHEWADEQTPDHAELQSQHQLAVTGRGHVHVVGLSDGRTWLERLVVRDDGLIEVMTKAEASFWAMVVNRVEPPVDGSGATTDALNARWTGMGDVEVNLPASLIDKYEQACAAVDAAEAHKDEVANEVRAALGEATVGLLPDGRKVTWRRNGAFGSKRFAAEHPDLVDRYTTPRPSLDVAALRRDHPETWAAYRARPLKFPTPRGDH